jgi:hypothetical protein
MWHEKFAECLRNEGFEPCIPEPDIWIRRNGERYEYIAVYVNDLAVTLEDNKGLFAILADKYNFKLKGTGPLVYHLGCDFERDEHGVLCMSPKKYIDRMTAEYERIFGTKPSSPVTSPLEKNDHPEIDIPPLLDDDGIHKYQPLLVGSSQWAISLGHIDITVAVMTLSGFRSAPRKGHLDRAKRLVSYLSKMKHGKIRFRVGEPDYSDLPVPEYDWFRIYGDSKEQLPHKTPILPLGILHLMNQTPIDWYAKKQATVETATYGSEFVAARTCVEQIMDLRTTLRYLGVRVSDKSFMFGDNESVVNSSIKPEAKLHKRHNALSFHRVRECIAAGFIVFTHIPGVNNPADILSKHWGYAQIWSLLKPLMFHAGDTAECPGPRKENNG